MNGEEVIELLRELGVKPKQCREYNPFYPSPMSLINVPKKVKLWIYYRGKKWKRD